jgi:anti-anti-sigma factor
VTDLDHPLPRARCACPPSLHVEMVAPTGSCRRVDVRLAGELDIATVDVLADVLAVLPGERPELVVMNVSELQFVDARRLRAFHDVHRELAAVGCRFVRCAPTRPVTRALAVTSVDSDTPVRHQPV